MASCPLSRAGWSVWMALTQALLGYEWFTGGWEKLGTGFSIGMGQTLAKFAEKNPHTWYVNSTLKSAMANPALFAWLVKTGELAAGAALLLLAIVVIVKAWQGAKLGWWAWVSVPFLAIGVVMNVNFYYAAGWMSPSTSGLNMIMFWMQALLIVGWSWHYCVEKNKA